MRKQQKIWLEEHSSEETLPRLATAKPSSALLWFIEHLQKNNATSGKAVDIGVGKGRNSVHLAKLGFEVYAMEYIQPAVDASKQLAEQARVSRKVHFALAEIDKPWQFEDDFFDVAIDVFSSIDVETKEGRETYRNEMLRTLKPDGYALVAVCSADDEWESEMIASNPGPEPNSGYWPSGKFQKNYDEPELRDFYKDFEIVELKKVTKPATKLGRDGMATNFWLTLRRN